MAVSEEQITEAFEELKPQFLADIETTTLKKVRRVLEHKLGLAEGVLDAFKQYISSLVDEMMKEVPLAVEEPPPVEQPSKERAKGSDKRNRATDVSNHSEQEDDGSEQGIASSDDEDAPKKKRARSNPAKKKEKRKPQPKEPRQPAVYSRHVNKLRDICKRATITIAPALYKRHKNDSDSLAEALENLLEQHGLNANSGEREIARAKQRLAKQRDLDGIDLGNIISEGTGRPRRAAAAAAQENYRSMLSAAVKHEPEDSESESGSGSEEEEGGEGSGGSDSKPAARGRGAGAASEDSSSSESGQSTASGSGGKEEEWEGDDSDAEAQPSAKPAQKRGAASALLNSQGGSAEKGKARRRSLDENSPPKKGRGNIGNAGRLQAKPTPASQAKGGMQRAAGSKGGASGLEDADTPEAAAVSKRRRVVVSDEDE